MIKRTLFFLYVLALTANYVNSFSPNNFCILPEEYRKVAVCKQYQCENEFCATDEKKCKTFIGWTILLDKNISSVQQTLELYTNFVLTIKECASTQYVMMKSDVCQNTKICYEKKKWTSRMMFKGVDVKLKKQCPCRGKHEYNCGNGYCAVNKKTCQLVFESIILEENVKEINICNN